MDYLQEANFFRDIKQNEYIVSVVHCIKILLSNDIMYNDFYYIFIIMYNLE